MSNFGGYTKWPHVKSAFDAFDMSFGIEEEVAGSKAVKRVKDASNRFLDSFLNLWILLNAFFLFLMWKNMPGVIYAALSMLLSGIAARYTWSIKKVTLTRWVFFAPQLFVVLCAPFFINGIRTPILVNVPWIIILSGWMLGRRVMVVTVCLIVAMIFSLWYVEAYGWWEMKTPLRSLDAWLRAYFLDAVLCALAVAALIGSYQAELRRKIYLEARLASVVRLSRNIIRRSLVPMCIFDINGTCIEANDACLTLFGLPKSQVIGREIKDLTASVLDKFYEALTSGECIEGDIEVIFAEGKKSWLDVRFLPFETEDRKNVLVQYIDITHRKNRNDALEVLAFYDSLTGLPNRRLLYDRLDSALSRCRRQDCLGAVFFLDLDNFKKLNDTHGHSAGDRLLQELARRLSASVRETDTVARLGGDEFVLLLEQIGLNDEEAYKNSQTFMNKLIRCLEEPCDLGNNLYSASVSIGYKLFNGTDSDYC